MGYARRDASAGVQSFKARQSVGSLPKGVPVPGLRNKRAGCRCGSCACRRAGKPSGVSANEKLLPHRYADEGDKGPEFRRMMRRVSRNFWLWDQGVNGNWARESGR